MLMKLRESCSRRSLDKWIVGSLLGIGMLFGTAQTARAQISEAGSREFRRIEQPIGIKVGVAAAGAGLIGLELWWFRSEERRVGKECLL